MPDQSDAFESSSPGSAQAECDHRQRRDARRPTSADDPGAIDAGEGLLFHAFDRGTPMIASIIAAAMLQAAPSSAAGPAPGPAAVGAKSAQAASPGADVTVCRTMIPLGSHVGKRECMTKADWTKYDAAVDKAHARNGDMGGRQGACLPMQPCRNGPIG